MNTGVAYESNIFQSGNDVPDVADVLYEIGPRLELSHGTQNFGGTLRYRPTLELFQDQKTANGVDQVLYLDSNYSFSPRSEISMTEFFGYVRNLQRLEDPDEPNELEVGQARTTENRASVQFSHTLTPRSSLNLSGGHSYRKSSNQSSAPFAGMQGSGSLTYLLTRDDVVGVGATYNYSSFADEDAGNDDLDASRTQSTNAFLLWSRTWDRRWQTSMQVGPAWVTSNQKRTFNIDCTGVPTSPFCLLPGNLGRKPVELVDIKTKTQNFTYFGNLRLTRFWARADANLSYRRSLSSTSSVGANSVIDSVIANFSWDPTLEWRITARAGWNQRKSTSKITQYSFSWKLRRRITDRISTTLSFRYLNQRSSGGTGDYFFNYQANLGFRYDFAPVRP